MYEVNRKLLQQHAAPLMAVYLHGVAVVRQELNMDVGLKSITGLPCRPHTLRCLSKMCDSLWLWLMSRLRTSCSGWMQGFASSDA